MYLSFQVFINSCIENIKQHSLTYFEISKEIMVTSIYFIMLPNVKEYYSHLNLYLDQQSASL